MPTIKVYDQQTTANLVGNIAPASNVSIDNSIGQGLGALSQGVNQVAGEMFQNDIQNKSIQIQQQKQAADIYSANIYSQAVVDWNKYLIDKQNQAQGPASGFTQQFQKDYKSYMQKALEQAPDDFARNQIQEQFTKLGTSLTTQAQDFENKAYLGYKVNQVQDTIQNSAKASAATQGATAKDSIDNLTNVINGLNIPQDYKYKLLKDSHNEMWNVTIDSMIANNPQKAYEMIAPSLGKYPDGSKESLVIQQSQATGVSPLTTLALMGSESGISATAKNPNSTAFGALQFTDSTWKEYGGTNENRGDLNKQVELGTKYIADQQNYLRTTLGREPTPGELKAGVMFRRNADEIIKASPDTPIESIIGQKAAAANNMSGKTTGEVMNNLNSVMDKQIKKYSGNDNYLVQTADAQQIFQAGNRIQSALNQQLEAQRTVFNQSVQDQIAQAGQGILPQKQYSINDFASMYRNDPGKAQIEYDNYQNKMRVGNYMNQLYTMTPDQAQSTYLKLTPQPGTLGYEERLKEQQAFKTAMDNKAVLLQKDPASYFENNPYIATKKQTMLANPNNQQATQDYYSTLYGIQKQQGIANPKLLSNQEVTSQIETIKAARGQDRIKVLQDMQTKYGPYFKNVGMQLQTNDNMPEGLAAILSAPAGSKSRAALLSDTPIKTLQEALPEKDSKDVSDQVASQMKDYYKSLPQTAISQRSIQDVTNNVLKAALDNRRLGMSSSDAAASAYNQFLGKSKYNYLDSGDNGYFSSGNATVRVPVSYNNPDQIKENLDSYLSNINVDQIDTRGVKVPVNPFTMGSGNLAIVNQIKSKGYWQTNMDDSGVSLFFIGSDNVPYPVMGKDGKQITKSFQELESSQPEKKISSVKLPGLDFITSPFKGQ